MFRFRSFLARARAIAWAMSAMAPTMALAGEHVYTATHPAWQAECGACHLAYPPALLPASSWRALMAGLREHFGTDASLDGPTAAAITAFLESSAGRGRRQSGESATRITETVWFRHEHDEIGRRTWSSEQVMSAANCAACHTRAAQGDYGERSLRIPGQVRR